MAHLLQDARFALRMLRKRWGITLVAVVSLATAIGGNTAVFSLVSAVLLQPTSVVAPERVMLVRERPAAQSPNVSSFTVSLGTLADLQERSGSVDAWAAFRTAARGLRGTDRAQPVTVAEVTPGFFELVGAPLHRGRGFRSEEGIEGAQRVAVIRAEFARDRFAGESESLGKVLMLDGEPHEVVGVLPPDFNVLFAGNDIWVPLIEAPGPPPRTPRDVVALARLSPDATPQGFAAEVTALASQLEIEHPEVFEDWTLDTLNYRDDIPNTQTRTFYALLQGSVFFVLLIACANVTNLLLARAQERRKEIAMRLALGAGRWRIARQLLTESSLLVTAGMALGLVLGWYGVRLMVARLAPVLPANLTLELDAGVLLFTLAISCLTGLIFGIAPALQSLRHDHADAVQEGGGRSSGTRGRRVLSRSLVVAEIALSLIALGGGAVMIRAFLQLRAGEPGFDPAPILTAQVRVPPAKYPSDEQSSLLLEQVLDAAAAVEGADEAAAVDALPRGFATPTASFRIAGTTDDEDARAPQALTVTASPGYLATFGINLLQGRFFEPADRLDQAPVVVVNRAFAEKWFPDASPLGQHIELRDRSREIVGVVEDIQQVLIQTSGAVQSETIYVPFTQAPASSYVLTLRARGGDPHRLGEPLRAALRRLDPDLTLSRVLTMNEVTDQNFAGIDIFNAILGGFGVLAILLASVGSYGVLAYSVHQRRNEIGIRMALGAGGRDVVWMVARQGVLLAVVGLGLGGLCLIPLVSVIRSLMAGISEVSGATTAVIAAILFAVTVVASLVPACHAARVNPILALKQE